MKENFRITFHNGPNGNLSKNIDVCAESSEEARRLAFQMPEARDRRFTGMLIREIPRGPSVIGIKFEYKDNTLGTKGTQYLFIKANDEGEAARYYIEHYKNTRFDFPDSSKIDPSGRCVRGKILETYFAGTITGVPNYDADATLEESKTLDNQIRRAEQMAAKAQPGGSSLPAKNRTSTSPDHRD